MKKSELNNGFVLYGEIVQQNDAGVWFKTKQETSFINFLEIKFIKEC